MACDHEWVHGLQAYTCSDLGPGAGVSAVSALCLRGQGVQVIAAATDIGLKQLMNQNHRRSYRQEPGHRLRQSPSNGPMASWY